MPHDKKILPQEEQEKLIGMSLFIEMAKADGFFDVSEPLYDPRFRKIYDLHVACFLRVLRRMIEQGECMITIRG